MPIQEMPPKDLVRGLMRGDRLNLKLGYTATNAALAARDIHHLAEQPYDVLLAYAKGFRDGMDCLLTDVEWQGGLDDQPEGHKLAYRLGVFDGLQEDSLEIYPSSRP